MKKLLLAAALIPSAAFAIDEYWVTAGDGLFSDISNWTTRVPLSDDRIFFDQNLAYTVTLPGTQDTVVDSMFLPRGNLTFDLSSKKLWVASYHEPWAADDLIIGSVPGQSATLNLTRGGFHLNAGLYGSSQYAVGVGAGASGTINLINDTYLRGGRGRFGVNGGTGSIFIGNGTDVVDASYTLGESLGGTGFLTVDGPGSTLSNRVDQDGIDVGGPTYSDPPNSDAHAGTGYLTVQNGGVADLGGRVIVRGGSIVTVTGPGSRLTIPDTTHLQVNQGGALNISDGAEVVSNRTHYNNSYPSLGVVTVTDGGIWQTSGRRTTDGVWFDPNKFGGTLNVSGGSLVKAWKVVRHPSTGELYRDGGLLLTAGGVVNLEDSRFEAAYVGLDPIGYYCPLSCLPPPVFNMVSGELSVDDFAGSLVVQSGLVDPGNFSNPAPVVPPTVVMRITGNYTQTNQTRLRIEINGYLLGSQYDSLDISGTASIAGTLDIVLNEVFPVSDGDTFDVLKANVINGQFDYVPNACVSANMRWDVIYDINPAGVDTVRLRAAQLPSPQVCTPGPKQVQIDADAWNNPNVIRPDSNNLIPAAVLGSSTASGDAIDFDVTQINPATLKLGVGEALNIAVNPLYGDYDHDGNSDAAFLFRTQGTGIFCDDTEVSLTGATFSGVPFEGTDAITTTDCESTACHP